MSDPADLNDRLNVAVQKAENGATIYHDMANKPEGVYVDTASGPRPSLAEWLRAKGEVIDEQVAGILQPTLDAADRAELAAANAAASANQKPSIADGLATTEGSGPNNRFFSVPAEGDTLSVHYRNDGGSAVEIGRVFSASVVAALRALIKSTPTGTSSTVAHIFEDGYGFVLAKLLRDGALDLLGGKFSNGGDGIEITDVNNFILARFGAYESMIGGLILRPTTTPGIEITDQNGFVLTRFDGAAPATTIPASSSADLNQQQQTDRMHVLGYGQSLSKAVHSVPAISTTQPYGNLMPASGLMILPGEAGYNASSFVPLVEKDGISNGSEVGESPVSGLLNGVVRRAVADGEASTDWVFVGSATGYGGRSVEALSPGGETGNFEKMVELVRDCAATAAAEEKSYSVWAYTWDQGENNYGAAAPTKSPYKYMQLQLNLFDELTRRLVSITTQKFRPFLFTYQCSAHRRYSKDFNGIALAQWRASRQRPDVVVAVPVYIMPVYTVDNLHLTNEGSWLLGEYRSRAMYETMIRRERKWRPLEPVSVDWAADHIDIKFHVPRGELVLDTALCAAAVNFGFDVRESNVVATDIISSVTVFSRDTIRIALSRPASVDAVISYARGRNGDPTASGPTLGPRGNLRDTHGLFDTAISPLGNTFALHNPCVMFQYDRRTGF